MTNQELIMSLNIVIINFDEQILHSNICFIFYFYVWYIIINKAIPALSYFLSVR